MENEAAVVNVDSTRLSTGTLLKFNFFYLFV